MANSDLSNFLNSIEGNTAAREKLRQALAQAIVTAAKEGGYTVSATDAASILSPLSGGQQRGQVTQQDGGISWS